MQKQMTPSGVDGPTAWLRLLLAVLASTVGGVGMWSVVVALPSVQAAFHIPRAGAALPYTLTMIGVAGGNVVMGRLLDRVGIRPLLLVAGVSLGLGYFAASRAAGLGGFALASFLPIAFLGSSVTFGPLMADVSQWFVRRRGLAVSICAAGNYFAGALWPPLLAGWIDRYGWREAYLLVGLVCAAVIVPVGLLLGRRPPAAALAPPGAAGAPRGGIGGLGPGTVQALLCLAGVACCVAMAMPQVHLVAYCSDLGFGPAHGADMLSLMLAFGVVSRIGFGAVADRIGGLATLLLGSLLQLLALVLYLGFDGLGSLYVISALFGLFQGGIVPSYAVIVREYFPAREAGLRIGITLTATMLGMALGGWMSGVIFDLTGSYRAAFLNGIGWNALNGAIMLLLLHRAWRRQGAALPA